MRRITPGLFASIKKPGGGGASTPPVVTVISPTPGGSLGAFDDVIVDVTDVDSPEPLTVLIAKFAADGKWEVIFDRTAFAPQYGASVRMSVTNGFRYTLRRQGDGWPAASITFDAIAVDDAGGVAT